MDYLIVTYLFIAFAIIIYLKGWKRGVVFGITALAFMILLSWAEDVLFNNSAIITVVVLFIISILYEKIEQYIKSNTNKTLPDKTSSSREEPSDLKVQHRKSKNTFTRNKNHNKSKETHQKKK